jgi:hypothetical protein
MYKGWRITRWETPVSDLDRVLMVSLTDAKRELTLIIENPRAKGRPRWRVKFHNYPAYRNIDEAYRMDLWLWLDESCQRCGTTFVVDETPIFASWETGYLQDVAPNARHFVIATDDDVIEILSTDEPIWQQIDGAKPDEALPGKANHLYAGEDNEEIRQLITDVKRRNRIQ